MDCPTPRPSRQAVLIVADGDYLEFFSDKSVDVHVAKVPQPGSRSMENLSDFILESTLPHRYRSLFDRSKLRGNAIIRPLSSSDALQALRVKRAVVALNQLQDELEGDRA